MSHASDDFETMIARAPKYGADAASLEQALREKHDAEAGGTYKHAERQIHASGDEIRAALATPGVTSKVADGLVVRDPEAEREARQAAEEDRLSVRKTGLLATIVGEQNQRANAAEAELAVRDFHDRYFDAESKDDVVSALAELRQVAPGAYGDVLAELSDLEQLFDLDDGYLFEDVEDDEGADTIARTVLNGEVARKLEREFADAEAFLDQANAQLGARAALHDRQERVRAWQIDNKFSKAEATSRYAAAELMAEEMGYDLDRLSGAQFDDVFRFAVAALDEVNSAERQRAFKQQLMDTPGTIGDGIEVLSANGTWVRPNAVRVEARPVTPESIERRANLPGSPRVASAHSAAEIKAALRADIGGDADWKAVQARAGKLFAAAEPKPQHDY